MIRLVEGIIPIQGVDIQQRDRKIDLFTVSDFRPDDQSTMIFITGIHGHDIRVEESITT